MLTRHHPVDERDAHNYYEGDYTSNLANDILYVGGVIMLGIILFPVGSVMVLYGLRPKMFLFSD